MWLIPTRNRPEVIKHLIDTITATGDIPDAAVMIDGDADQYKDVMWPDKWKIHSSKEHLEMQRAINSLFKLYPNEKCYGILVDHCEVLGAGWPSILEEDAGDWCISFSSTGVVLNPISGHQRMHIPCIGGELARALGYVYPDFCTHLYGDDALEDIGYGLGIARHSKEADSLIKIKLFDKGEINQDENHNRMYEGKHYFIDDRDAYHNWEVSTKQPLMEKLNHIINDSYKCNPKPITVACVKWGVVYSSQYVNNLFDMVKRNMKEAHLGRFVCLTEDSSGLDSGVEVIDLPPDLHGWWGKLYMFKKDIFAPYERVLFIDLDTLIIGSIDDVANYRGDFAILRDFYRNDGYGSGVMMWNKTHYHLWDEWDSSGRPLHPLGDQGWIEQQIKDAELLQDIFPGKFASFKADCHPYPPKDASVICFHGQPKPDNCMVGWVDDVWKIGGSGKAELEVVANTNLKIVKNNVLASCARDLEWLGIIPEHDGQAVIVAGGPSLSNTIGEVKWRNSIGQTVIAVNGAAKFLNEKGITPDIHIIIDSRPENARFIRESNSKSYWLASQCHPWVFDFAPNSGLFHMNTEGISDYLPKDKESNLISSGTTVGLAAMAVAYCLGYRSLHLHGFDSSYEYDHHAYKQAENDQDAVIDVSVDGRKFKAAPWMVRQAQEFQIISLQLLDAGVTITVAGDGLLPHIAHCMSK